MRETDHNEEILDSKNGPRPREHMQGLRSGTATRNADEHRAADHMERQLEQQKGNGGGRMYEHKIIIPGEPYGMPRPRFAFRTGAVYTPTEAKAYKREVAYIWNTATAGEKYHGLVRIDITAYFPIPKSATKSAQEAMRDGTRRPNRKPDGDNIDKIIWDALNGVAYDDDKQVAEWSGAKYYSDNPRVEVTIKEI